MVRRQRPPRRFEVGPPAFVGQGRKGDGLTLIKAYRSRVHPFTHIHTALDGAQGPCRLRRAAVSRPRGA